MDQFAREICRYERVSHPGIVRFLGIALPPDSSAALLVTQLMHGGSLGKALDVLRRDGIALQHASIVSIALQACGGLRALHAADCIWGDAKPENILLSAYIDARGYFPPSAEAKIADFGLSRSVTHTLLVDTTLAASGLPPGTYVYMSPETFHEMDQIDADIMGKASDVFSFGMILYEMLTLRTPWRRKQLMEVADQLKRGARPKWPVEGDSDYLGVVPDIMVKLVESCWAQNPAERPTAEHVFQVLDQFSTTLRKRGSAQRGSPGILGHVQSGLQDSIPVSGNVFTRVASKQSTVSTAVAIGDNSVDLQSSGLHSTTDTVRYAEVSDDGEHVMCDDVTGMGAHINHAHHVPRVSPVTSPEPHSLRIGSGNDKLDGEDSSRPAQTVTRSVDVAQAGMSVHLMGGGGSLGALEPLEQIYRKDSDRQFGGEPIHGHILSENAIATEITDASVEAVAQHALIDEVDFEATALHDVPTPEFDQRSEQVAHAIATAAQVSNMQPIYARRDDIHPSFLESVASNAHVGDTIEGSTHDLTSSNTSTASLRRKRSKRLQAIIEKAALAFIELRRREEMTSKMPPKQRKEAADRKAFEEARLQAETHAQNAIQSAHTEGDFSTILGIMRDHRQSQSVVLDAALLLEFYSKKESVYFDLCEEGGIEELMSAVIQYGDKNSELCVSFCNSMCALSEHFDDKVGHLVRATGVPTTIIEILEHHVTDVSVQIAGCKSLAAIAGTSELSRSAVATLGGPKVVYRAMAKNNSTFRDVNLARASMRAVRQIAQDNERAAEFLVQVCALDAVSRTAEVFTDNGIENDILAALRAFSFYTGGRRNIIMSSGLRALAEIMLRNREPEFLIQCCQFIRAIAQWRNIECEEAMLRSCIAERIITLTQFSNEMTGDQGARVSWYALQACLFLASFGSRSRQRLRLVGAIDTTVGILNSRRENARVVRCATDALAELMKGELEAKQYAMQCGAMPALRSAKELHLANAKVKNAVQWTMDCMQMGQEAHTGPAQGSQVHQELMKSVTEEENETGSKNKKRLLGFHFWKRKGSK